MAWDNNRPTHVPTPLRDACLTRDGNQCTATRHDGTRCPETTRLEADHRTPTHQGGPTTLDNLTTLCHWHHNRKTQREAAQARQRPPDTHPSETHPAFR